MINQNIQLEYSWLKVLKQEFQCDYMQELKKFLLTEKKDKIIYPPSKEIFNAFNQIPFDQVKVVIIGQDPYHGENQAHGLSFSVKDGVKPPPSLRNIFIELNQDLNIPICASGNLNKWAKQGVLLLNSVLTVEKNNAFSHQNKGWEIFTDKAIYQLSQLRKNIVYLLWGNASIKKQELIDSENNLIIKSTHPSPFSAHRGFLGSKPFSRCNEYLLSYNIEPIDWNLN